MINLEKVKSPLAASGGSRAHRIGSRSMLSHRKYAWEASNARGEKVSSIRRVLSRNRYRVIFPFDDDRKLHGDTGGATVGRRDTQYVPVTGKCQ